MPRIRTFIAVDPGDTIRRRTAALQQKLAAGTSGVRWEAEANMHVTLLFLGEVEQLEVVQVCRVVQQQAKAIPAFQMTIAGLGAFPTPRRPKVLWAGITEGTDGLHQLHAALEGPLLDLGCYRREERAYSPHLTLGRITHDLRGEAWPPLIAAHADWSAGTTLIDEVLVMSSESSRNGPVYTVMGRGALKG